MQYLVGVDHIARGAHLTRNDCVRFYDVLYIQCSAWKC